jgi:hypothetical protein
MEARRKKDRTVTGRERYHECDWFRVGLALRRNSRKTERGAGQFLIRLAVRAAPFALLAGRGSVTHSKRFRKVSYARRCS